MNTFLCLMMLLAGFPREEYTDYRFLLDFIDGDISEMAYLTDGAWFALFETDSGYELLLTPERITVEEGERPAGTFVDILNESEDPLFFVWSSESAFTEGPIYSALDDYQQLGPDTSITLNAQSVQETRLFTTEKGLFLSDNEICQHITDTRPSTGRCPYIAVVWAGDLDRDGIIDLIIDDVSDSYNYYDYNLYLSSEAGPDSIVRLVASFYDVYY